MKKIFTALLLVITTTISLFMFSACVDKDSEEYKYNIKRFVGDYEMQEENFVRLYIYDFELNGISHFLLLHEITETAISHYIYVYNDELEIFEEKIETFETKFDANLVKEINNRVELIGTKAKLSKSKIGFKDSSTSLTYKSYNYSSYDRKIIFDLGLEGSKLSHMLAYYRHSTEKHIEVRNEFDVEGTDGTIYSCNLRIDMKKV